LIEEADSVHAPSPRIAAADGFGAVHAPNLLAAVVDDLIILARPLSVSDTTTINPIQGEAGMTTTKDWDAVDWSNDDDIIASVAPWITPQELDAIREDGAPQARTGQDPCGGQVHVGRGGH
jgi:hypothetical protein